MGVTDGVVQSRWLARRAAAWVARQRDAHRPFAQPLDGQMKARLEPYFDARTLAPVRVREVPRIDPPWPLAMIDRVRELPLDFDYLWGITFVDTILVATDAVSEEEQIPNVFHECVHVVQYTHLGLVGFMRRYLEEWVTSGYSYWSIGLERHAFDLQRRFSDGAAPFPVEAEVNARLAVPF